MGSAAPAALTFKVEHTVACLAPGAVEAVAPWAWCGRCSRYRHMHAATAPASGGCKDWRVTITGAAVGQTGIEECSGRPRDSPKGRRVEQGRDADTM